MNDVGFSPKRQLPKCAISQVCPRLSAWTLVTALGLYYSLRLLRRPNLTFGKLPLKKFHNWEIGTWKVALGKIPFGENKYVNTELNE